MWRRRLKNVAVGTAPVIAVGAWVGIVTEERRKEPADVRFSIGSADDVLTEHLKTGDVLLFSRNWTHMLPGGAALSVLKKKAFGTRFDHAGVIVSDRFGTPHVAEVTYTGVKLRRFDERILRSKCDEIVLLPLNYECGEKVRAGVERHVKGMAFRQPIANMLWLEFLGIVKYKATAEGEWDKPPKYPSEPNIIGKEVPASPAVQLVMSCLDTVGIVDGEEIAKWKHARSLTTRDLEERQIPLAKGAEFGESHCVRMKE